MPVAWRRAGRETGSQLHALCDLLWAAVQREALMWSPGLARRSSLEVSDGDQEKKGDPSEMGEPSLSPRWAALTADGAKGGCDPAPHSQYGLCTHRVCPLRRAVRI